MLAYAALALWLTRGVSFTLDELQYFAESHGFAPDSIAYPIGGHLTAVTRLFSKLACACSGRRIFRFSYS